MMDTIVNFINTDVRMMMPMLIAAMGLVYGERAGILNIGATNFVQKTIVEERDRGTAVLLVSTELEEIQALSDRIAVMFEGQIMGIVPPDTPIHEISMMMAGIHYEDIQKENAAQAAQGSAPQADA